MLNQKDQSLYFGQKIGSMEALMIYVSIGLPKSCIIQSYRQLMCFFKSLEFGKPPAIQPCQYNCHRLHNSSLAHNPYFSSIIHPFAPHSNMFEPPQNILQAALAFLPQICSLVQTNNQNLFVFEAKLRQNEKILQAADNEIIQMMQNTHENAQLELPEVLHTVCHKKALQTHSILRNKLFGEKIYKYRLKLKVEFPKVIYKERRLHLSVKLLDSDGKIVRNANLLHLCLTACDSHGDWILQEDESFFMHGTVEVDLYKGEAEFSKVYPADISRYKAGGKVGIVIYPKSSLLNHTGSIEKGQVVISHEEIQPLCIQNVLVKAKKRQRY